MAAKALALLLLASLLAGCSSTEPDPAIPSGEDVAVYVSATTGAIRGVIVDTAIRPIEHATITAVSGGKTYTNTSNASGRFGFSHLEPGAYFVRAAKAGFTPTQTSVEVQAGEDAPPLTRIALQPDAAYRKPYVSWEKKAGFVECTTSLFAVCGFTNFVGQTAGAGNLTADDFGLDFYYEPDALWIQSELFWASTQSVSAELTLEMENIAEDCPDAEGDYVESVSGPSPIFLALDEKDIREVPFGGSCPIFHSVFSGGVQGIPLGLTFQQKFEIVSHSFYGFTPPDGWRFSKDGDPRLPA